MKGLTFSDEELATDEKKEMEDTLESEDKPKKPALQESYEELINSTMPGLKGQALLNLIGSVDFYQAPASSRFHGNFKGGLAQHTLLVVRHMIALNEAWEVGLEPGSLVLTGILHDIAKAGYRGQEYYLKKPDGKYSSNDKLPSIGQNTQSLVIALMAGIELSNDEIEAIMGQDGLFTHEGKSVWDGYRSPKALSFVMHYADNYVSSIIGI